MNDRRLAEVEESLPRPGDDFGARIVAWANAPRDPERQRMLWWRLRREVFAWRAKLAAMSPSERETLRSQNVVRYRETDAMTDAQLHEMLERGLDDWMREGSTDE